MPCPLLPLGVFLRDRWLTRGIQLSIPQRHVVAMWINGHGLVMGGRLNHRKKTTVIITFVGLIPKPLVFPWNARLKEKAVAGIALPQSGQNLKGEIRPLAHWVETNQAKVKLGPRQLDLV